MATFIRGMTRGPMPMRSRRMAAQTSNQSAESRASAPWRAPQNLARSATRFRTIIVRARSTSQREEAMNARSQRERSRREFVAGAGACALAAAGVGPARAAMGPDDKFDLLIKGAEVLDPSQSLRGRRDIGIRYGRIEALEAEIPAERALRVLDAGGKLATPGLIDLHAHVYPYGSAIGIPADELVPYQATTTLVSAGDAGANNFPAFRRHIVGQTRCRLYAFVHIANIGLAGFPVPELFNIGYADAATAARAVAENADLVLGIKVRMSENVIDKHGLEPLKRAIAACEAAGTRGKVMCH